MKITQIDTYLVNVGQRNWPFVVIQTDQGIHGVGEAYSCGPDRATVEASLEAEGRPTATCRGVFVAVKPGHPAYHRW